MESHSGVLNSRVISYHVASYPPAMPRALPPFLEAYAKAADGCGAYARVAVADGT